VIKKLIAAAFLCATSLCAQNAPTTAPAADSWKSLEFLMGTWEAKIQGGSAGAAGSGTYTFQLELRNHILARHSTREGCKGPETFDCEHGDLLYVYQDALGQPYKAIYFDNEGHVIHYDVSAPSANSAVFISDSSQPGPQFRLTYELRGSTMYGKFQMRMPGQAEFKSYLEWSGTKR
jgi:hypothetical protein